MIEEVPISLDMIRIANRKALRMGVLNNSITNGRGTSAGYIGEMITAQILDAESSNTYDYDLILNSGETVDVKTKRVTSPPKEYYSCSVANFRKAQNCDYYAFTRVTRDLKRGWYLGKIKKEDFFNKATYHKRGDIDSSNNFTVSANCYNIPIKELK